MKVILKIAVSVFFFWLVSSASAQIITCPTASDRQLTAYTNGQQNDSIFFICGINPIVATTDLIAVAPAGSIGPYNIIWQQFVPATNSWTNLLTLNTITLPNTLTGVGAGGYRAIVQDAFGQVIEVDVAWVCEINALPSVSINNINPGCGAFMILSGNVNMGNITGYYNPPADIATPLIVDANTDFTVCFNGTHTFNSDMIFQLVGPASCGSPVVTLSPFTTALGQPVNCNPNDNFTNLCFTNTGTTASFNMCTAGANMTGSYGNYGITPGTPIDWSPLYGCDATDGFSLQVQDCWITDAGTVLNTSSLTVVGLNDIGVNTTLVMNPAAASTLIIDGTGTVYPTNCATTTIPLAMAASVLTPINFTAQYQWTANPPASISSPNGSLAVGGPVNTVVTPAPTVDTQYTLTLVSPHPGNPCGGTFTATALYDYIGGSTPIVNLPNTMCIGAPAFNLTTTPTAGTWTGTGVTGPSAGVYQYNPGLAGSTAGIGVPINVTFTPPAASCYTPLTTTVTITAGNTPAPTLSAPSTLTCVNSAPFNLTSTITGGLWSGTGITSGFGGTFNPTTAGVGTWTITYTPPAASCAPANTIEITVQSASGATLTDPGQLCVTAAPVALSASVSGGTWAGTGITDAATGSFNPNIAGAGTWPITYTTGGPCPVTSTQNIQVVSGLASSITAPPTQICSNATPVDLNASVNGGTWSGSGITNSSTGLFDPSAATAGPQTITFTPNPGQCYLPATATILVVQNPNIAISSPGDLCVSGSAVTLSTPTAGGLWSGTGITNGTTGDFNPNTAGIGSWPVTYTTTGVCANSSSFNVNVVGPQTVDLTFPAQICESAGTIALTANVAGGTWSGTGVTGTSFDPTVGGVAGSPYTITYLLNDVCATSTSEQLEVVTQPVVTITDLAGPVCSNSASITLNASIAGGTWTGTGITNATTGAFSPALATNGNNTITYSITGLCATSDQSTINVVTAPNVSISSITPFCVNSLNTTLNASPAGGTWSGNGVLDPATGSFSPSTAGVGTPTITYTYTSGPCTVSANSTVTINGLPAVSAGADVAVCAGSSIGLQASGANTYQWSIGGGAATGLSNSSISNPQASPANTTTYTVLGVDGNGCTNTDNVQVTVNNLPNVSAGADASICPGIGTGLAASGATSYSWTPAAGLSNAAIAGPTANPSATTTYTVTGTDANGCVDTDQVIVTVFPQPSVNATSNSPILECGTVTLNVTGLNTVQWSTQPAGNGTITNAGATNTTANPSGTGSVTYVVAGTDANGCVGTASTNVVVNPLTISINPNVIDDPNGLIFNVTSNGTNFDWDFGDGGSTSTQSTSVQHQFTSQPTGDFFIVTAVVNNNGCEAEDTLHVFVDFVQLTFPNIVVLGGNQENQVLQFVNPFLYPNITALPSIINFKAEIFNRWGGKVGEVTDPTGTWDPSQVEPGAYFYVVSYEKRSGGSTTKAFSFEQTLEIIKK